MTPKPSELDRALRAAVSQIGPNPDNPRGLGSNEDLLALGNSMLTVDQQTAITIFENLPGSPFKWTVLHGNRRVAAAKLVGIETLLATVTSAPVSVKDAFTAAVADNRARLDLTPHEDVMAVARVRELNPELTSREIARRTGHSEAEVSKCLAIHACPVTLVALADGRLKGLTDSYAVAKAPADQKEGLIALRQAGGKAQDMAAAAKPKKQADTVKLSRVTVPLTAGTRIVVTGADMSLQNLIDVLGDALSAAKAAQKDRLDVKTFEKVARDKAKAGT